MPTLQAGAVLSPVEDDNFFTGGSSVATYIYTTLLPPVADDIYFTGGSTVSLYIGTTSFPPAK